MSPANFDLYLVTDRFQTRGRDLLSVLEQALDGGVKAIQLREKDLGGRELFALAEKARKLCARYNALLLINDRVDVALAIDAAGVQLGKASLPIGAARSLLGPEKLIGASVHSLQEAHYTESSGADFLLFGPVYFTPSKAAFGAPQGLAALKKVVENSAVPVYAIGGIKPENINEVRSVGVHGIAVISALVSADDPRRMAEVIASALRR